jgi:hypothetical protein
MIHDRIELSRNSTAYPILVAILLEHLPVIEHSAENAAAPQHDAIHDPTIPSAGVAASGSDSNAPILLLSFLNLKIAIFNLVRYYLIHFGHTCSNCTHYQCRIVTLNSGHSNRL